MMGRAGCSLEPFATLDLTTMWTKAEARKFPMREVGTSQENQPQMMRFMNTFA